MARHGKHTSIVATLLITLLILASLSATGYMIWLCLDLANKPITRQIVSEEIQLPVSITETETSVQPEQTTTAPPETMPIGTLLEDRPNGYACISLRPTMRSAEDRYFYAILPDQTTAIAAIEAAESKRIEGKATNGEPLTGLMVEYQNGLWYFTQSGALCNPWERIEPEDADALLALCMQTAEELGFTEAICPSDIRDLTSATMTFGGNSVTIQDTDALSKLERWFSNSKALGPGGASCWFTAFLTLEKSDGSSFTVAIATDSCNAWMTEGVAYEYRAENEDLFHLFSMTPPDEA